MRQKDIDKYPVRKAIRGLCPRRARSTHLPNRHHTSHPSRSEQAVLTRPHDALAGAQVDGQGLTAEPRLADAEDVAARGHGEGNGVAPANPPIRTPSISRVAVAVGLVDGRGRRVAVGLADLQLRAPPYRESISASTDGSGWRLPAAGSTVELGGPRSGEAAVVGKDHERLPGLRLTARRKGATLDVDGGQQPI